MRLRRKRRELRGRLIKRPRSKGQLDMFILEHLQCILKCSTDHTAVLTTLSLFLECELNPLTTDDAFWRRLTLAACYQLAQSVLKIGSALAERVGQGEVGGCTPLGDSAWRLLQLAVEKPWSMLGGPFVCFLAQTGVENAPFTL